MTHRTAWKGMQVLVDELVDKKVGSRGTESMFTLRGTSTGRCTKKGKSCVLERRDEESDGAGHCDVYNERKALNKPILYCSYGRRGCAKKVRYCYV